MCCESACLARSAASRGACAGVIGCFLSKCQRSYHFPCAKEAGCVFVGNYSQVYCPEHRDEGAKQPEQVFQVERILKHKLVRGKKLYLVKWQGYPESECTWEPQESFYSSQVLDEYEESLKSARALAKGTPVQEARSASVDAEEAEQESEQGHEEGQKSDAAADAPAEIETPKPRRGRWGARTPASGAKAAPDAAKSGSPAAPAAPSEQTAAKPDDLAQSTPSGRRKGAAATAVAVPVAEPQPSADETPPAKRAAVAQKETPPAALQPVSSSRKRGAPSDVANASATSEEESTKRVKQSEAAEATATPTTGSRLTRSKGSAKTESAGPSAAAPETETAPFAAAEAGGGAQPAAASLATAEAEAAPATAASAPPPPAGAGAEVEQGAARAAAEAKEEAEQRPGRRTPRPQSAKPKFAVQRIPLRIKYVGGDEVTSIIEAPPLAEWPAL